MSVGNLNVRIERALAAGCVVVTLTERLATRGSGLSSSMVLSARSMLGAASAGRRQ
jgi:hypothetical protein